MHHRRVCPSSAARLRQGSYRSRDARDGYVDEAAEAERTRRAIGEAQATTLRRKGRLLELHRRMAAVESEEREAAKAAAKAQLALDRVIRTATVGAFAGPTPSKHRQCQFAVDTSRGRSFLDDSVSFMASSARVEFSAKLRTAVVARALGSPDVRQAYVDSSTGGPVGTTGMVQNGAQLLAGSAEGRPGWPTTRPRPPCCGQPGGTGGAPPIKEAARRLPRSVGPPPWGWRLRGWWPRRWRRPWWR